MAIRIPACTWPVRPTASLVNILKPSALIQTRTASQSVNIQHMRCDQPRINTSPVYSTVLPSKEVTPGYMNGLGV